jgi:hypothetical protein
VSGGRRAPGALVVLFVLGLSLLPGTALAVSTEEDHAARETEDGSTALTLRDDSVVLALLDRALEAAASVPMRGRLTVASFAQGGPQITTVEVARREDGRLRATRQDAWELGRDEDGSYLRSPRTGRLLELGGVERRSFDRERFLARYRLTDGGAVELDTGPARTLAVTDRTSGLLHELLHLDDATGLIVRRETFDEDGAPVRVVAYTDVEVDEDVRARPSLDAEDLEVDQVALSPIERRSLAERGVPVDDVLPGGFELLGAAEVDGASVPTVHLRYGDGLYTLSVYVQLGELAIRATRDAKELELDSGGTVWRWPGSEPRRVVWSGDGRTFTALTDAPTGILLTAVAGLPNDPAPSTLRRTIRGFARVAEHLLPPWG